MMHIVGIDEAGRGPLAGPVAVGGVCVEETFNKKFWKGIQDSKKLSETDRELWFALAKEGKNKGELNYHVALVSERVIDKHGIAFAIRLGISRVLERLGVSTTESQIFLDGGIKAPIEYKHQLTVIKGDEKIPIISLASICAKVTRDRYMKKLAEKHPNYKFETHKGYGTKVHTDAIKKYGVAEPHRMSFLKNILKKS